MPRTNRSGEDGSFKILTANRLTDGAVVFLTPAGEWSRQVGAARRAAGDGEIAVLEAGGARAVADRRIVGPYLIDVDVAGGAVRPRRLRERIRAFGPTVKADRYDRAA